jgi:beta-xylosidase
LTRRPRCFRAPACSLLAGLILVGALLSSCRGGLTRVPPLPRLGAIRDAYDGDIGDPSVLPVPGGYAVFGTDDAPDRVPTATSTDLLSWTTGPDAVPTLPSWADPDPGNDLTWAPSAIASGGGYLLFVTVHDLAADRQCVAVLVAAAALGPYRDGRGSPLVCQAALNGSIDPSVVVDAAGGHHLVWRSDSGCCGPPAILWEQDLRPDGLALVGEAHRLLTADRPWQDGVIENPAMLPASRGGWWLFYSGNRFDSPAYATGLAWCQRLAGPCREVSDHPFLAGSPTLQSPGGMDFFRDAAGRRWAAFATWNRPPRHGRFFCCRSVELAPILST